MNIFSCFFIDSLSIEALFWTDYGKNKQDQMPVWLNFKELSVLPDIR